MVCFLSLGFRSYKTWGGMNGYLFEGGEQVKAVLRSNSRTKVPKMPFFDCLSASLKPP